MLFKHFFVIVALFAITVPCLSQSSQDYGKYANNFKFHQGYVVTRSGDKIQGLLKHFNDLRVYAKVVFVSQKGEKTTYYPSDLKEYKAQRARFISNNFSFFEVILEDDRVGVYERKVSTYTQYGVMLQTDYFYKRTSDTELMRVRRIGFKKTFAQFFQDCPELQKKIEQKKFKYKNLAQMFGFYRNVCSKENNTEASAF